MAGQFGPMSAKSFVLNSGAERPRAGPVRTRPGRALLALFVAAAFAPALAADPPAALSEAVYRALQQAQRALDQGQPGLALERVEHAATLAGNDYDHALVAQNRVYVELARDDPEAALRAAEAALARRALPRRAAADLRYLRAQLLARQGRTADAIGALEHWLRGRRDPPVAAELLLARLYQRSNQPEQAAARLERLLTRKPGTDSALYRELLETQYRLGHHTRVVELAKTLIARDPQDADAWTRLAAGQLAAGDPQQSLATLALAHRQGRLRQAQDLLRQVQLYRREGLPWQAAELLRALLDRGELAASPANLLLLADAWQQAREWQAAAMTLERLLSLLDGRAQPTAHPDIGQLYLRLGIAHYRSQNWSAAGHAWRRASDQPSTRAAAGEWLATLDRDHPGQVTDRLAPR